MNNLSTANKVRNLRAGHITTFDMKESDGFVLPKGDTLIEDTLTIYPASVALLQIKIVESESLEPH